MSASQLIDQGRSACSSKDYQSAVKQLGRALATKPCSNEERLTALDARAQCLCKLGQYDLALNDARHMLHTSNKRSLNGFLRCSQIERLLGNYPAAIKWLEHGSRNLPQHQKVFQTQLEKVKSAFGRQVADQKRRDPVTSVPLEVLQLVLSHLDYRQVVRLLQVSRTWQRLLSGIPPLTTTIDFSRARRKISYQACHAALRRLCAQPQKFILHELVPSAVNMAQSWLSKYPHLEKLEILSLDNTTLYTSNIRFDKLLSIKRLHLGELQRLKLEKALEIIAICKTLEEATMHVTYSNETSLVQEDLHPNLQHLCLINQSTIPFSVSAQQIELFPNLRSLTVRGALSTRLHLRSLIHLRKLDLLLTEQHAVVTSLPDSLEELNCVRACPSSSSHPMRFLVTDTANLQNLHTISLEENVAFTIICMLEESLEVRPRLQTISLAGCPPHHLDTMARGKFQVTRTCRKLTLRSEGLEDLHLNSFTTVFPAVEEVTLEAPLISGVFISGLVQTSSQLRRIHLRDCIKVSPDIQEWLRAKNIECRISKTAQDSRSARRVRDIW